MLVPKNQSVAASDWRPTTMLSKSVDLHRDESENGSTDKQNERGKLGLKLLPVEMHMPGGTWLSGVPPNHRGLCSPIRAICTVGLVRRGG